MTKFYASVTLVSLSVLAFACSSTTNEPNNPSGAGNSGSSSGGTDSSSGGDGATGQGGSNGSGGSKSGKGGSGSAGKSGSAGMTGASGTGGGPKPCEDCPPPPDNCGLENAAFCETFETKSPGGRAGDLDEKVWHFARYGHQSRKFFIRNPANTDSIEYPGSLFPPVFCGQPFSGLLPYDDVAVCDGVGVEGSTSGQLNEVFDDQGDFAFNSMRIRQMFDFTGRTGTVVFDVDAKVNPYQAGHGWWVELFITADPQPMPYHGAPGVDSFPRQGVGFAFQGCDAADMDWSNRLTRMFVTDNYQILHDVPGWELEKNDCFTTEDLHLNRFKFLISKDTIEIWVSDVEDPTNPKLISKGSGLDLPFERGYVHIQHSQYNAHKDGSVTPTQTYRWDNVGFDGPVYALPRSYEIEDNDGPDVDGVGGREYGYYLTDREFVPLELHDVDLSGNVTKATFSFSFFTMQGRSLEYRFNGGPTHSFTAPDGGMYAAYNLRSYSVDVPVEELVDGTNLVEVKVNSPQEYEHEAVANLDLTLEVEP